MPDYVFKTYLADGREHFLYGEMGDSRAQLTKKDFPFPESLLRLLYLDIWAYDGQIKQFDKLLMELYRTREEKCARQLLPLLDELAESHIYFQLLRLDWRARLREARRRNYENILDLLPHKEITHIPSNIHAIQTQVLGLIQKALDTDARKGSLEQKLADYYAREERRFCAPGASMTSLTSVCGSASSGRLKCGCARTAAIGLPLPEGRMPSTAR